MDSAFSIHSFSSYFGLKLETRNPALGQKLFCWIFIWLLVSRKADILLSINLSWTSFSRLRKWGTRCSEKFSLCLLSAYTKFRFPSQVGLLWEIHIPSQLQAPLELEDFLSLVRKVGLWSLGFFVDFSLVKWLTQFDLWKNWMFCPPLQNVTENEFLLCAHKWPKSKNRSSSGTGTRPEGQIWGRFPRCLASTLEWKKQIQTLRAGHESYSYFLVLNKMVTWILLLVKTNSTSAA